MKELLDEIKKLEKLLAKIFKISNLGDSKIFLKIDITIINHSESAILVNSIISRKSLINIIITISKLEKYQ